jgi:hypothetical protein
MTLAGGGMGNRAKSLPVALAALLWTAPVSAGDGGAVERAAHDRYVAAINSNDLDTLMGDLTDDVVYQAPGAPEIVGKPAVRKWASDYLAAYHTIGRKCRSASPSAETGCSSAIPTDRPTRTGRWERSAPTLARASTSSAGAWMAAGA